MQSRSIGVSRTTIGLSLAMVVLTACEGNVETRVLPADALTKVSTHPGVIIYQPQFVKLTHSFTTLVNETGQVIGDSRGGKCTPVVQKEEITIMADLSHPMLIRNNTGGPSSAKFSVTLNNGMLVSVNSEPTEKLSEVLKASVPVLGLPAGAHALQLPQGTPACNAGATISKFEKAVLN